MSANFPTENIVIGGGHKPGYRMRQHLDQNVVNEMPVLAGQRIAMGDIITATDSGLAANFETGNASSSYNTADLRNGAFQALNPVDNSSGSDGDQLVTVVGPGGFAELYAAAGVEVNNWVEIDVNDDAATPAARMASSCASSEPSRSMAAQAGNTTAASSPSLAASSADQATQKSVANPASTTLQMPRSRK